MLDMYGMIIKESKGYFISYTFEHFDKKIMTDLKRRSKRIIYLQKKEWSKYLFELYGLDKNFKESIVSGDIRMRKPERKILRLKKFLLQLVDFQILLCYTF